MGVSLQDEKTESGNQNRRPRGRRGEQENLAQRIVKNPSEIPQPSNPWSDCEEESRAPKNGYEKVGLTQGSCVGFLCFRYNTPFPSMVLMGTSKVNPAALGGSPHALDLSDVERSLKAAARLRSPARGTDPCR